MKHLRSYPIINKHVCLICDICCAHAYLCRCNSTVFSLPKLKTRRLIFLTNVTESRYIALFVFDGSTKSFSQLIVSIFIFSQYFLQWIFLAGESFLQLIVSIIIFSQYFSLCGNCAFPQNFHTRKLGEIMVFFSIFFAIYFARWTNMVLPQISCIINFPSNLTIKLVSRAKKMRKE